MGVLKKSQHERFAQLVAREGNATQAYVSVYGAAKGAGQSAARLLKNADVASRIEQLRAEVSSEMLTATVLETQNRLRLAENRYFSLMRVVDARAAETSALLELLGLVDASAGVVPAEKLAEWSVGHPILSLTVVNSKEGLARLAESIGPGMETGWVLRDYRGKSADRVIFKEDTSLAGELRAIEESVARQMGELNPDADTDPRRGLVPVQVNVNFGNGNVAVING